MKKYGISAEGVSEQVVKLLSARRGRTVRVAA
jgi:hypothetical protein